MPEILVCCGGHPTPARARAPIVLDIAREALPEERLKLECGWISEELADDIPPAVADLLELATYVYSADRMARRGSDTMGRMGADWRRRFRFLVRVRKPELWSKPEVSGALVEALAFLSDDSFEFSFEKSPNHLGLDPYLGIDQPEIGKFFPDEVMLFSGGLDSLGGAVQFLHREGRKVALVAHQSATYVASRQQELAGVLAARFPGQVFFAPVRVVKGAQKAVEHTQRLRSFLFIALAAVMARMYQRNRILMFENGITSFNLPVAEHVVGTRSSRTTHPRTLAAFERLLRLLGLKDFRIANPFIWRTKAEIVSGLADFEDLIPKTTSCASVRDLPMQNRQCGICSQCVGRRLALLSAGMEQSEPPDSYAVDLFTGAHKNPRDPLMAELVILQASRFAQMTEARFAESYGQCFRALPELGADSREGLARIHELHLRYGKEVSAVVDQQLKQQANLLSIMQRHDSSLLARLNMSGPMIPSSPGQDAEREQPASEQAMREPPVTVRRIAFAFSANARVLFEGGIAFGGNTFSLLKVLAAQFRKDLEMGLPKERHTYVSRRHCERELGWTEEQLRSQVLRTRRAIEKAFANRLSYELDPDDVIQSRPHQGYRINPQLLLVDEPQLRGPLPSSRNNSMTVTTTSASPRIPRADAM